MYIVSSIENIMRRRTPCPLKMRSWIMIRGILEGLPLGTLKEASNALAVNNENNH